MTRSTDIFMSLEDRVYIEKSNDCDLAISCHRNGSTNTSANGVEIWVHSGAGSGICQWAGDIIAGWVELGYKARGNDYMPGVRKGYITSPNYNYYVNANTISPSMLMECGFMGNTTDNSIYDSKLSEIAKSVVKSSCAYKNVDYVEKQEEVVVPDNSCNCEEKISQAIKLAEEILEVLK